MTTPRRRSLALSAAALTAAFTLLGFMGHEIARQAPPIPRTVASEDGRTLMVADDILTGQQVWQSAGGQELGSIWGHGAYQAPDWSADWLHREATTLLDIWARREHGREYDALPPEPAAALRERLAREMRTNRYDPASGVLTVSADRAQAVAATATHYRALFGGAPDLARLRQAYAMRDTTIADGARLDELTDFFFWTAWACVTERPGSAATYTGNWPHEPLVGNVPTTANALWSAASVVLLLAVLGGLVWYRAFHPERGSAPVAPASDPIASLRLTPSMRAVRKYLVAVAALFVLQVALGALTAHFTVEGTSFFGLPLGEVLPYALTRTWHIQTAMFWIATAFLATGLFLAPAVGGAEPRGQRLGVNVLFVLLLVVIAGSLLGEMLAIHQRLGIEASFWLGHQGYEYLDLGRVFQVALFGGLLLWLFLMLRALAPALRRRDEARGLAALFAAASVAIGLMYGAGLLYGARTHLAVAEYWRWWVVHLWVEGFFEVFATAALAFVFARFGLVRASHAAGAVLASATLFLVGGVPGTLHHLYFSGAPTSVLAVGSVFSALEVVPLVLVGFEAFQTSRAQGARPWMARYRWPIRFFVGVSFWNLVGAGIFGFLINPPLFLYYLQGLNTTPVHAHTALFGVYGLLALGLVLFMTRRLDGDAVWDERPLALSFWAMNAGLALMVALSLLPIGVIQAVASVERGLWFARSAELLQQPLLVTLRWLRLLGDTVFLSGVGLFTWFLAGRLLRRSSECVVPAVASGASVAA